MKLILKILSAIFTLGGVGLLIYGLFAIFNNYDVAIKGFEKEWPILMMSAGLVLLGIFAFQLSSNLTSKKK